nr:heparinase II/III family protein [Clostridia bacterium]
SLALSPVEAGLAASRCFFDTGYAFLRSGWESKDLVFALQSGGGTCSRAHEHRDRNAFQFYAKGELFVCDPGHSCYRSPAHDGHDTQTFSHSTWTLNRENQQLAFLEKGMEAEEARAYPSYHNLAVLSQQMHPQIAYVESQARRCYAPLWRDYTRRAFLVQGRYLILWDTVDPGVRDGALRAAFLLNNAEGALTLERDGDAWRVGRPKADLHMRFVTAAAYEAEVMDGLLHDAYHIHPGQAVQGRPGTGKRLELAFGAGPVSLATVLIPLDKDALPPKIEAAWEAGGRLALTVQLEGWTDRFDFDPSNCPAARYAREGGAHYEF